MPTGLITVSEGGVTLYSGDTNTNENKIINQA